jgi:hypothetical protein
VSPQPRTVEERIARIASAQHGIVTWAGLRRAGISAAEVRWRARSGHLIRVHRGVYRVGHAAPSYEATYLAAVKACGYGAALWHRAAAYHQGLIPLTRKPPPPQVKCPTERSVPGVQVRRCRRLDPLDLAEHRGIPTTTVPRTLLDLAASATDDELSRAAHEAWIKWRTGPSQVLAVLARQPNAKGAARLRRLTTDDAQIVLSRLERGFLGVLEREGVEPPRTNRCVDGKYVDCRWPGRLTVELDSYRFHNSRHAWEQGHARRRAARARREEFRRYTWWDVFEEGRAAMAAELHELLPG